MTTTPRFRKASGRGSPLDLSSPLPSSLTSLPAMSRRAEQYERVVARVSELEERVANAVRHLDEVRKKHDEAVQRAIDEGKPPPKARQGGSAEKSVEVATEELRSFSDTVTRTDGSADRLLQAAIAHVPAAAERASEEEAKALEAFRDLLSAADRKLEDLARFESERLWLTTLNSRHVDPFTVRESPDIRRLRTALSQALAEFDVKRTEREAEAERQRAYEAENRERWAAQEKAAREQQERERVVIADAQIIERGGKPVERAPFGGVQEIAEDAQA